MLTDWVRSPLAPQSSDAAKTTVCVSACKFGSDAVLMICASGCANQPGLKQVEFSSTVHLSFDQLELGDLALGLAV